MTPHDPVVAPRPVPDPTDPDPAMLPAGDALVTRVTKEVDTDDMFDPMAG